MAKQKKEHIGDVIRTKRKRLGLRVDDVALHCNVSRSRAFQWEKEKHILFKNLPLLALALDIPIKRLMAVNGSRARSESRAR